MSPSSPRLWPTPKYFCSPYLISPPFIGSAMPVDVEPNPVPAPSQPNFFTILNNTFLFYPSMASRSFVPLELEVTISSAKDLKNVNWRHGNLKPYAVVWVDPKAKYTTNVDDDGDTCPIWNETLLISLTSPIEDSSLHIDIVQAYAADDVKPLIGSSRIPIQEIIDDVGFGEWAHRSLKLKRPSGRPQGRLEVKVLVKEPRYRAPDPYYAPPYGVPPPPPYGVPTPTPTAYSRDYPSGYPNPYPNPYNNPPEVYGTPGYSGGGVPQEKKSSKYGVGTGLAIGAVAGVLGGLAIAEGVDYVEEKIADDVDERVENDLGYYDDDGGFGGDGF